MAEHSGYLATYDFSLNIYPNLHYGLLKTGKTRTTKTAMLKEKKRPETYLPAPVKFWIAGESESKALAMQKVIAAESKGFVLENGDIILFLESIYALANGEKMQFVVRYPNEKLDVVVGFSGALKEHKRKLCLPA